MKLYNAIVKCWEDHPYRFIFPFVAISLFIMFGFYLNGSRTQEDVLGGPTQFGQFGDFVGGVLNPILGFLTVLLLIGTSQHSRKELELSRQEYTRRQLEDALEALFSKHKLLMKSPVNTQFFNHLDYFGDITLESILESDSRMNRSEARRLGIPLDRLPPDVAALSIELRLTMAHTQNLVLDVLALTQKRSLQDYWTSRVMGMMDTCHRCGLHNDADLLEADTVLRNAWVGE